MPNGSFDSHRCFATKVRQIDKAKLNKKQFCFSHNKFCPIYGQQAVSSDLDMSGLPCPDMSQCGDLLKEEGRTNVVFCAHAKFHVASGTKMLVLENVEARFMENNSRVNLKFEF